jgi:hypothetical protein
MRLPRAHRLSVSTSFGTLGRARASARGDTARLARGFDAKPQEGFLAQIADTMHSRAAGAGSVGSFCAKGRLPDIIA